MSILVCPLITKGLRSIRGYTSTASYLQPWQQDISFSKPLSIRKEGILYFFFFFWENLSEEKGICGWV
jgi:hypothetical protein